MVTTEFRKLNPRQEAELCEAIQQVRERKVVSHQKVRAKIQNKINQSLKSKNIP